MAMPPVWTSGKRDHVCMTVRLPLRSWRRDLAIAAPLSSLRAMHDDPTLVIATVAAMIGGLLAFALLLLGGGLSVRWLKLPRDLPEGPRHEPPPPAIRSRGDRVAAAACAQRQAELQALYSRAWAVSKSMEEYQKVTGSQPHGNLSPEVKDVIARMDGQAAKASASVLEALAAYDARLRKEPGSDAGSADFSALCAREGALVTEALATLRSAVDGPAVGGGMSRRWLLVIAVILVLWLVALLTLARH